MILVLVTACASSSLATVEPNPMPSVTAAPIATLRPSAATASATHPATPEPSPSPSSSPSSSPSPLALRASAGILLDASVETYRISGTTASELLTAMRAKALRDSAGDAAVALTTWHLSWSYGYRKGTGSCEIRDLVVRIKISVLMPSWAPPSGAEGGLVTRWNRFIDALRRHERGHEQNGIDRAKEVRDAMRALGPRSSCPRLERAADAAGDAVIDAGQDWDRTYDDETDHGATQGVAFP